MARARIWLGDHTPREETDVEHRLCIIRDVIGGRKSAGLALAGEFLPGAPFHCEGAPQFRV